ncbi:MAG: FumA C-terminus/TtdB family hydratase beta subunit [Synergistaceae bacterium]|jgi:fumarate hydratase subunit beta|nr:FumA C-terminus/TtdB family hydratase beta subunit [Synergistaceae bacterium]
MSSVYHLTFPFSEEETRNLKVGDIVYINGHIHTMRDMGHARALDILKKGEKLPFDLSPSAIWHCAPIVKQDEAGKWFVTSAGSTTSSRFTPLGSEMLERLGMKATLGKGTMKQRAVDVMKKIGSVYLNTTGGTAALYAQQIEDVEAVHWLDLGLPEAIWVLRVKEFGPLIVGIDSYGNSLYENIRKDMNVHLKEQLNKAGISISKSFTYLPVNITGRPREL